MEKNLNISYAVLDALAKKRQKLKENKKLEELKQLDIDINNIISVIENNISL